MKRSEEKWESSIRVKEYTEELELTSGGREFHRRHDEGMKEERYREEAGGSTVPVLRRLYYSVTVYYSITVLQYYSVTETVFASIIYRLWNAGGETGRSLVVHEFPEVDKLCSTATPGKCGPSQLFQ